MNTILDPLICLCIDSFSLNQSIQWDSYDTGAGQSHLNYIPLNELIKITGGLERDDLARFYKYHFIDLNPPDMKLMHVSRTAGMDRIVDDRDEASVLVQIGLLDKRGLSIVGIESPKKVLDE